MHGVPRSFLRNLNSLVEPPDLTILLEVDYDVLVKRIKKRKSSKFSENVASLKREVDLYRRVGRALKQVGHKFVVIRNEVGHFDETVEQIDRLCDAL
jgi:thymidylate kinase